MIHCTDLFHPHEDPDDHFDLATMFSLPGIDLKAIILDQGQVQLTRPGKVPVDQLNHLARRKVPAAIGLADKLRSPDDKALDQKPEFQNGVGLILSILKDSRVPVAITTVGSVRDVVAAFNREPELLRRKVARIVSFIGDASDPNFIEWNVSLDPRAYAGLMRSGLPVYWVPCFDGGLWTNNGHASFWQAAHRDLLAQARPALVQYFIYALEKEKSDPIAFLSLPVDAERKRRLLSGTRNMWCGALLELCARPDLMSDLLGFSEVDVSISDDGYLRLGQGPGSRRIMRFGIRDRNRFAVECTQATARRLIAGPAQGVTAR